MSSGGLQDVLPCDKCHEVWECPRDVEFMPESLPGNLAQVDPYTTDTIVVYETFKDRGRNPKPTFSRQFFENIRFTYNAPRFFGSWGSQHRLVRTIDYTDDDIFYTPDGHNEHNCNFAQLITLNSWYQDLSACLLFAIVLAMDHMSSFSFSLWALEARAGIPSLILVMACPLRLILELVAAKRAAEWVWFAKRNASSGDLISNLGKTDMKIAYYTTTLMIFLEVPGTVRDVVINLHPWKAVQPYAAFKCEGHRATVIGHRNRIEFKMATSGGLNTVQHCRLITKLVFLAGQIAVISLCETTTLPRSMLWRVCRNVIIAVKLFLSTLIACMYLYRSTRTQMARNLCYRNLVKFFYNTAGMHDAHIKVQRRVAQRNLAWWFHQQIHEDKEHLLTFTKLDIKKYQDDFEDAFKGCLGCGRPKERVQRTRSPPHVSNSRRDSTSSRSTDSSTASRELVPKVMMTRTEVQKERPRAEREPLPPHLLKERQNEFDNTFALPPEVKLQKDLDEELQHFSMEEGVGTHKDGASRGDAPPSRQGLSHQQLQVPRKDSLEYSRKLNRSEAVGAEAGGLENIQEEAATPNGGTTVVTFALPDAI